MKSVAIVSPDTVPLTLKDDFPETIKEGNFEFSTKDKCIRTTAPGKRSWRFAEYLSKQKDFDVTLFVPELNFPPREYIDTSNINFELQSYNYKAANWEWSSELDRKLKKYDFVVIQTTSGTGFLNGTVLPRTTNLILDGWIPFLAELPCVLLNYGRMYRKVFWSKKFLGQYQDLLRRANCVLYANERQHYYYEGQFFMISKLDWSAYKFSPLLKIPYGVDEPQIIEKQQDNPKLNLLWYGPIYPWYAPEVVLDAVKHSENVNVDFVGVVHPRYKKIYNSYYRKFFEEAKERENINIVEEYCDDSLELFKKYDAGITIARDWLEEQFSHRCRILEQISNGFPVIINNGNALYEEVPILRHALHPVHTDRMLQDLDSIAADKTKLEIDEKQINLIYEELKWEKVLAPVVDYINNF